MIRSASGQQSSQQQQTWSVKLSGLPPGTTPEGLRSYFQASGGQFYVLPAGQQKDRNAWLGYLNGLTDTEAKQFQDKWNNHAMHDTHIIRCELKSSQSTSSQTCSVQLTGLPPNTSAEQLKLIFGCQTGSLYVPQSDKQRDQQAWCSFLNGLAKSEAEEFCRKWNGHHLQPKHVIKCQVQQGQKKHDGRRPDSNTRSESGLVKHEKIGQAASSSASSLCSTEAAEGGKSVLCRFNILGKCRFGEKCSCIHFACLLDNDCCDEDCCLGHSPGVKTTFPSNIAQSSKLCLTFRYSNCKFGDECRYQHIACPDSEDCGDTECFFGHPDSWGKEILAMNECFIDCDQFDCKKSHPVGRVRPCRFGDKCSRPDCNFLHSMRRKLCDLGEQCEEYNCKALHPPARKKLCEQEGKCAKLDCEYLHPLSRQICERGTKCPDFNCDKLHGPGRTRKCRFTANCKLPFCPCLHPADRKVCERGDLCDDVSCAAVHPVGRCKPCRHLANCWNASCELLHPDDWNPCPDGFNCRNFACSMKHSLRRPAACQSGSGCQDRNCAKLHPELSRIPHVFRSVRNPTLKSEHQRGIDRAASSLPVLSFRETFVTRLQEEKVLIVRAETGSGKTTQLPQYAAEHFGGLVICTQPRVMAAISIAQRVADEFDGGDVGESVGYKVGGESGILGTDIMFMTEASLIRYCQDNDSLDNVSVLIIDEAHERSLNVDIVLGLAKLIRGKRPGSFHVVIASATIDPKLFKDFFDCDVLDIPGRMYNVTLQYIPPATDGNPDVIIKSHLVPVLIKALETHTDGYALVFLPGEREIQQAMKEFEQLRTSSNWVALPLYGSLPREEQTKVLDFVRNEDNDRLVAFCTNVAETSLTIKDVRLVVDSGLAKESRFDAKRRITILEMKQISLSSANQRKGRAGRTAAGHCVRLYSEEKLQSASFLPEILRSSLDLVVLQLLKLKQKPLNFPFIERPDVDLVSHSYQTLLDLGCLGADAQSLSRSGELFAELGLDPRLSAFLTNAHQEYGQLDLAVTIACILTAPGTLFFMGGDKMRQETLRKRAFDAFGHQSDILYEVSIFNSWLAAGTPCNGKCTNCGKPVKKFQSSCRPCRIQHSSTNRLNNKVLEQVEKSKASIFKSVKLSKWYSDCRDVTTIGDPVFAVSRCLEKVLSEQVVCLLVQQLPSEGVKIVNSDIKAQVSNTSVFAQRTQDCQYFVAMQVKQMTSGSYIVDGLHPLKDPQSVSDRRAHPLLKVHTEPNSSNHLCNQLKAKISECSEIPQEMRQWISISHNADEASIDIYTRACDTLTLPPVLRSLIAETRRRNLSEQTIVTIHGMCKVAFTSGLQICSFEQVESTGRAIKQATDVPVEDEEAFHVEREREPTQLLLTTPPGCSEEKISAFSRSIEMVKRINNSKAVHYNFFIDINNLPPNWTDAMVEHLICEIQPTEKLSIRVSPPRQAGIGSAVARIAFKGKEERDSLFDSLRSLISSRVGQFSINLISKKTGRAFSKLVEPLVSVRNGNEVNDKILLRFRDAKSASEFASQISCFSDWSAQWTETVYVSHSDLFPDLEDLTRGTCGVEVTFAMAKRPGQRDSPDSSDSTVEIRLYGTRHSDIALVSKKLRNLFSPTTIRYASNKERTLLFEIRNGPLKDWMAELKLQCEFRNDGSFRVFGPKMNQGTLMRLVADEFARLESRYHLIPLGASTAQLFRKNLAGDTKLQELKTKWDDRCFIKFLFKTSEIEIYARQDPAVIPECVTELQDLLRLLGANIKLAPRLCVFCSSPAADQKFQNCGHAYCRCIANQLQSSSTPICCKECKTPISIKEIKKHAEVFEKLAKVLTAEYVATNPSILVACCIVKDCDGFVKKNSYETCARCNKTVCITCKTVDDILHRDRSCAEFKKVCLVSGQVSELIKAAEVFVRRDWPADMPPITDIACNPGLMANPPCHALKLFLNGMSSLRRGVIHESVGFFAYHGSSAEGLTQICHVGFDPNRRAGQAYGPGEYFGVSASVSRGYSRNCGAMIVAFLLNGGPITHQPGFCYVMNNPRDGSAAFNLPVLVVYFDKATPKLNFITPAQSPLQGPEQEETAGATWKSPFRWHWMKDGGRFEPYTDDVNRLLEAHYDKFRTAGAAAEFRTPPITRYVDDIPCPYDISFAANTQKNSRTGYERNISRVPVDIMSVSCTWEYRNESNLWQPFESLAIQTINKDYQSYLRGTGSYKVRIQFPGRPELYELDFLNGHQTNTQSQTRRFIRKK